MRIFFAGHEASLTVKTGSSYLSQSELPVTFGLGAADTVDRVTVEWPSGSTETAQHLKSGTYNWIEGSGARALACRRPFGRRGDLNIKPARLVLYRYLVG